MNKEDLESKSDFELSAMILRLKYDVKGEVKNTFNTAAQARIRCVSFLGDGMESVIFNINNPSDMMPLVFENKISIAWNWECKDMYSAFGTKWVKRAIPPNHPVNIEVSHDNPLRAAAIVYLLMMEGE